MHTSSSWAYSLTSVSGPQLQGNYVSGSRKESAKFEQVNIGASTRLFCEPGLAKVAADRSQGLFVAVLCIFDPCICCSAAKISYTT